MFRHPKTRQEAAQYADGLGRAKRSPARLPNAFTDIQQRPERSWKRHRKNRWK